MLRKILVPLSKRFSSSIAKVMEKECIVPDLIDCAPQDKITVTYAGGVQVLCGNELTPTQVKGCPSVKYCADSSCYYTLIMTNPDAPCRANPVYREWHHWLIGNIPGDCVSSGEMLSEYIGALPPEGSGLHRYVFLVFKQPKQCCFDEPRLSSCSKCYRAQFSTRKFCCKYQLGPPIAGNFFQAQFDCYVPVLTKQISG